VAGAADPKMTCKPTAANGGGRIDIVNDVWRRGQNVLEAE
jgi:hypothetical protein